MDRGDLAGYLIGQFLGGLLGGWLLIGIWGPHAANINYGITAPRQGYPIQFVFLAEFGMTFALVFAIFIFFSEKRLMRWTPLMTWLLVAILVWLGAPVSGTSLNPAWSFGPSFVNWFWSFQWLYWIAPPLGGLGAVGVFIGYSVTAMSSLPNYYSPSLSLHL